MKFDCIVIGAGPGGYHAALLLAAKGKRIAIIERDKLGGCCLNTGCIPTKLALGEIKNGNTSWSDIRKKADEIIESNREGINLLLLSRGVEIIVGEAKILDVKSASQKAVEVNGKTLISESIIVATGSKPAAGNIYASENLLTSDNIWEQQNLPDSIEILGGGSVGCEMATIFNGLGKSVRIKDFDGEILRTISKELAKSVKENFIKSGVQICDLNSEERVATKFIATGRKANFDEESAKQLGLRLTEEGFIEADIYGSTNIGGIYCIGDANGQCMLAHYAKWQAEMVSRIILGEMDANMLEGEASPLVPKIVFTNPMAAKIGLNLEEASLMGYDAAAGKAPYYAIAMAKIKGDTTGYIAITRDVKTDELLGAEIVGEGAQELIHILQAYMFSKAKCQDIKTNIFAHPTIAEGINIAICDSYPEGSVELKPKRGRK